MNSAKIARIRLAGFSNRQAGYGTEDNKAENGLPKIGSGNPEMRPRGREVIRLAGFLIRFAENEPESNHLDFGLPVSLTGWPVSRASINPAFRIVLNR